MMTSFYFFFLPALLTNVVQLFKKYLQIKLNNNCLILSRPLLPHSVFPSIRVFSSESVLHIKWPMYWSFSFSISSSNEYSGLISFRIDCLDLLVVQGTLKSLLQTTVQKHPKRWCCESVALNKSANLENSAAATGLEKVSLHSNAQKRQSQRMLKLPHNCTHLTW